MSKAIGINPLGLESEVRRHQLYGKVRDRDGSRLEVPDIDANGCLVWREAGTGCQSSLSGRGLLYRYGDDYVMTAFLGVHLPPRTRYQILSGVNRPGGYIPTAVEDTTGEDELWLVSVRLGYGHEIRQITVSRVLYEEFFYSEIDVSQLEVE